MKVSMKTLFIMFVVLFSLPSFAGDDQGKSNKDKGVSHGRPDNRPPDNRPPIKPNKPAGGTTTSTNTTVAASQSTAIAASQSTATAMTSPITVTVNNAVSTKGGKGGNSKSSSNINSGSSDGSKGDALVVSTGDQIFAPVLGWGDSSGGSKTTTVKNVADPNPPSMPAVTPCTTGASAGVGWAGGVLSFGGYYKDLMCLWERMHAVAVATNDTQGASEIREGMTMMLCEDTPPERRKFFKQCEALTRVQSEGIQPPSNPAFNSN